VRRGCPFVKKKDCFASLCFFDKNHKQVLLASLFLKNEENHAFVPHKNKQIDKRGLRGFFFFLLKTKKNALFLHGVHHVCSPKQKVCFFFY